MLSTSYNIHEFMEKVKGHSFLEIIWMTDQEATEVERYLCKAGRNEQSKKLEHYAVCLKDLILYVRHGIKTRATRDLEMEFLDSSHSTQLQH